MEMNRRGSSHQGEEPQMKFEERKNNENKSSVLFFGRSFLEIRPSAAMFLT